MKVVIGCVHGETINGWFFHSALSLTAFVRRRPEDLDIDDWLMIRSGPLLSSGRGKLIGAFLEQCPDAEALIMLDSDMVFAPEVIAKMVSAFERMRGLYDKVGVLGGLAFTTNHERGGYPEPTIWVHGQEIPEAITQLRDYPRDQLIEVAGSGAACLMIGRDVLETLVKDGNPFHHISLVNFPLLARHLATIDDPVEVEDTLRHAVLDSDQMGEDLSFCYRVKAAGYRIFIHTGLQFDHAKSTLIGEPEFLQTFVSQEEK